MDLLLLLLANVSRGLLLLGAKGSPGWTDSCLLSICVLAGTISKLADTASPLLMEEIERPSLVL